MRIYAGSGGMPASFGEAWAVADGIDFSQYESSEVSFQMDWWKNYYGSGYIWTELFVTDGISGVRIARFNSNAANAESGGGNYVLDIAGASAVLYREGSAITGAVDLSSLGQYNLQLHSYADKWNGYVPGRPAFGGDIHLYDMRYEGVLTPEPSTALLVACGLVGLAMKRGRAR